MKGGTVSSFESERWRAVVDFIPETKKFAVVGYNLYDADPVWRGGEFDEQEDARQAALKFIVKGDGK